MYFLLQSVCVGVAQGLLLDVLTGFARPAKRKRWLWTDICFGPLAAVITFFGALVIMDGQLHPLLFFGTFGGMIVEHLTVGVWVCRLIRRLRGMIRKGVRSCCGFLKSIGHIFSAPMKKWRFLRTKTSKNDEKE